MSEPHVLLVELTEDELKMVAGGLKIGDVNVLGIQQEVRAEIVERGGSIRIGGGSGATANTGAITLTETFSATITQTNTNSGSVSGNAVAA